MKKFWNFEINFWHIILFVLVFISAFANIYLADYNRRLMIAEQKLEANQDELLTLHGQLILEQSTWSTQGRVADIAQNKLNMIMPNPQNIKLIRMSPHETP